MIEVIDEAARERSEGGESDERYQFLYTFSHASPLLLVITAAFQINATVDIYATESFSKQR